MLGSPAWREAKLPKSALSRRVLKLSAQPVHVGNNVGFPPGHDPWSKVVASRKIPPFHFSIYRASRQGDTFLYLRQAQEFWLGSCLGVHFCTRCVDTELLTGSYFVSETQLTDFLRLLRAQNIPSRRPELDRIFEHTFFVPRSSCGEGYFEGF